jgi:hypothetical protein
MPKASLLLFVNALRSGIYKQCVTGGMKTRHEQYCPLGVLQQTLDGEVETEYLMGNMGYASVPTEDWLLNHGITFFGPQGKSRYTNTVPHFKLSDGRCLSVTKLNDSLAFTFEDIADLFEHQTETY